MTTPISSGNEDWTSGIKTTGNHNGPGNWRTYRTTYRVGIVHSAAVAANMMICLIHQTNYLLDRQLKALEQQFLQEGGFTERLYHARTAQRRREQNG